MLSFLHIYYLVMILVEVIIRYNGNIENIIESLGGTAEILSSSFAIVQIPQDNIEKLEDYTEIEYIELPKNLFFMLEQGKRSSCITIDNSNIDGLTGEDVIVGIIDSGIDYQNRMFKNSDGTTRIDSIYEVGGEIFYSNDINSGNINHIDRYGHGTQVASIAVGNNGIAYKSDIIVVKIGQNEFFASTTDIMRGISYIINRAVQLGKPVVINISYGTNDGSHDGNSLFEEYINEMAVSYKVSIVVASGNEGNKGHHFRGFLENNNTLDMDFNVASDISAMYLSIWSSFSDEFEVEIFSPLGDKGGPMRKENVTYRYRLGDTTASIVFRNSTPYNSDNEIYIRLEGATRFVDSGIWKIRFYGQNIINGQIDAWLPVNEAVGGDTAFIIPNTDTTLTIPSTSERVITVGAYDSVNISTVGFSGRGYTRATEYIKPDLVAPGVNILTTTVGGSITSFTGTSVAAPFVAGSVALLMEWGIVDRNDIFLYGERLKAFLCNGAIRDNSREYPNREWGYGTIDVNRIFNSIRGEYYDGRRGLNENEYEIGNLFIREPNKV